MARLEEPRWYSSAEAYRTILGLIREGRHHEALQRADEALGADQIGRTKAARLHSLICWLYTEELQQASMVAILHGEEAVRLAGALHDPWIKCEALALLVRAYCQVGDLARANQACDAIGDEVALNAAALSGGCASLLLLRATVARASEAPPRPTGLPT